MRRSRRDIMLQILDSAKKGKLKTKIMYEAGLSYSQLEEYLPLLQGMGLLRIYKEYNPKYREIYRTTPKGREYAKLIRKLKSMEGTNPFT